MSVPGIVIPQNMMGLVFFLLIASCAAILFRKLRFPYTIGLVIVGIILAFLIEDISVLSGLREIGLTQDIILFIILPALIFDASINIDSRMLVKEFIPVIALAAPGLIISTIIIGFFMNWLTPLSLGFAMLFGALISATDPVAVIALFKDIGAPKRLTLLVDGESLFNDATAIVAFNIILAIVVSGVKINGSEFLFASLDFAYVFLGGIVVGVILGTLASFLLKLIPDDPMVQISITVIAAYTAFIVAQYYFDLSGVMATLGAGIAVNWNMTTKLKNEVKESVKQFWEYIAFAANSFIFLLLGVIEWNILFENGHSTNFILYIIIAILIVTLARAVVVFGIIPILRFMPRHEAINKKYQTVIFWGGLRGAVPLALVLSMQTGFPYRQLITELTLGVVLFTLIVQGTTCKKLISLLGIDKPSATDNLMKFYAILESLKKASSELLVLGKTHYLPKSMIKEKLNDIAIEEKKTLDEYEKLRSNIENERNLLKKLVWYQMVGMEIKCYENLYNSSIIVGNVFKELQLWAELRLDQLKTEEEPSFNFKDIPFEAKIKRYLGLEIIHKFYNKESYELKKVVFEYQFAIARIASYRFITDKIANMNFFNIEHEKIVKNCTERYKERAILGLSQYEKIEKLFPVDALHRNVLNKVTAHFESSALKDISEYGIISDNILNELMDKIKFRVKEYSNL